MYGTELKEEGIEELVENILKAVDADGNGFIDYTGRNKYLWFIN